MLAGNTVPNSEIEWSLVPPMYAAVSKKYSTDPGMPIQSEYSMAVSTDDTNKLSSEYSVAGNVYSELRGEQPEYAVVDKPKNTVPSEEAKEPPSQPVNGTLNASQSLELSPSQEVIPVYAQPDLSKKNGHSSFLSTTESTE